MNLAYGHIVNNRYVGNAKGDRLANMISSRVSEANETKRPGLKMDAAGLVKAIDILRALHQWTAVAALVDAYGFSEREFSEAEYAAQRMAS